MSFLQDIPCKPSMLSPLTLAFVGDAVYELLVRERLAREANRPANDLHGESVAQVCAQAQARAAGLLIPLLNEEELSVYKRGRNAHVNHIPRHADPADYHAATGLETLFGFLYLDGKIDRVLELFNIICKNP